MWGKLALLVSSVITTVLVGRMCAHLQRDTASQHAWVELGSARQESFQSKVSVLMTADPGDLIGGYGESAVLLSASSSTRVDPLASRLLCVAAHRVTLFGFEVLLVTTGIGQSRAALCLDSVLMAYGDQIKEIIFLGTAGGSPARGGLIDSASCESEQPASPEKVVRLGDVCVSSYATNWDCQRCVYSDSAGEAANSACVGVPCSLHDRWDIFGDFACSYYSERSLADELRSAATDLDLEPPDGLLSLEQDYWRASTGLSDDWRDAHVDSTIQPRPRIFKPFECAETTSTTYWNGAPYDELARAYVADLITQAAMALDGIKPNITRNDVVAISAMEAAGWMLVLRLSEIYLHFAHLPSANVRAVSDYVHDPLLRSPMNIWHEDRLWLPTNVGRRNATRLGYEFAIRSSSAVVIALFRQRASSHV